VRGRQDQAASLKMYESFFHLRKNPFGMNPDPDSLFMTPCHREAFAVLLYAIHRRKGFVVLTGDAGTGKTTLLRALLQSAHNAKFSLILTPRLNSDEFLELALLDFGIQDVPATKSKRIAALQELLARLRIQGKAPVLIVDEAHTLSTETLEEIRLLTNFETNEEKLLQIVLAGQNELAAILNQDSLWQLKQRIEVRMSLKPLAPAEVGAYMKHRWAHAGGKSALPFSNDAIPLIARASHGIPRLINALCDNALLLAYAGEEAIVGPAHIHHVLNDLDLADSTPSREHGAQARAGLIGLPGVDVPKRPSPSARPYLRIEKDASLETPGWSSRFGLEAMRRKRSQS